MSSECNSAPPRPHFIVQSIGLREPSRLLQHSESDVLEIGSLIMDHSKATDILPKDVICCISSRNTNHVERGSMGKSSTRDVSMLTSHIS